MKISPLIEEAFISHSQAKELPKKHSLLHQGEVSRHAYLFTPVIIGCGTTITIMT